MERERNSFLILERISNHRRGKFTSWLFSPFNQPRLRSGMEEDESGRRKEESEAARERKKERKKKEERFLVTPWELETAAARPPPVAIASCRAAVFRRVVALSTDGSLQLSARSTRSNLPTHLARHWLISFAIVRYDKTNNTASITLFHS